MNIQPSNMTNFGAKFINSSTIIEKKGKNSDYTEAQAAFVEIDPFNRGDVEAVTSLPKIWKDGIYHYDFNSTIESVRSGDVCSDYAKVYALTTQKDDYENLKADKILGLAEVDYVDSHLTLRNLETRPKYKHSERNKNRSYKQVGSAIMDCVKALCNDDYRYIKVWSTTDAIPFYELHGFRQGGKPKDMIWGDEDVI